MPEHLLCSPPKGWHGDICVDCKSQYLSVETQKQRKTEYVGEFSDEEATEKVGLMLEGINGFREILKQRLQSHGDVVLRRWDKKSSKEKRSKILASTELGGELASAIPPAQLPEEQWFRFEGMLWEGARWMKMTPFAEDQMKLLSLLHVRSAYPPSSLALLDTRDSFMSFESQAQLYFNVKCVKMYEKEYGELVDWDEKLTHSYDYMGFPRAFYTLSIQLNILNFLHEVLDAIIQDAEPTGNANWTTLVAKGFRGNGCEALWSTYTSPAFAPPTLCGFDPKLCLEKAQAKLDSIRDEMWLMQVDPEYMLYVLRSRKACIVDSASSGVNPDMMWSEMAQDLTTDVMNRLNAWHIIVMTCKDVCALFEELGESIGPGKGFPAEANRRFGLLGAELNNRMRMQSHIFDKLLPRMAPLKYRFRNRQDRGVYQQAETLRMDPNEPMDWIKHLLERIGEAIVMGQTYYYGLSFYFDMLDRELLAQGPASHVDKRMYDQLSDIMAMDEMFQTWMWNQLGYAKLDHVEAPKAAPQVHYQTISAFHQQGVKMEERTFRNIGRHMRQFFETPFPKGRKDLGWLERATKSRTELSKLWTVLRDELRKAQVDSGMDMRRSAIDTIFFDSEPEYLAELGEERKICEQASRHAEAAYLASLAAEPLLSEFQNGWGGQAEAGLPVKRKQTKAKAARDASACADSFEEDISKLSFEADASESDDAQPNNSPILLKSDSMHVFKTTRKRRRCWRCSLASICASNVRYWVHRSTQ